MFKDTIYHNDKKTIVKNLAIQCRNNENLCGKSGFLYEPINKEKKFKNYEYIKSFKQDISLYEDNLKEVEQIEKELVDIFQRMRKHNTITLYKTSKEIYKLINKKK
jgi:hypothetical protein